MIEESEAEVSGDEEDEDEEDEEDGDDEDGDDEEGSDEKKVARAETRRRVAASRRGHRKMANLAGYSSKYVSSNAAFDASAPIVTLGEVKKAAKWCPGLSDKPAFEGIEEFDRRVRIAQESLPDPAAKVLQANAEHFLRRLTIGVVTRQADASLARASAAMVAAEMRPLRKVLQFSFAHPHGVLRHAQFSATGKRLNSYDGDATKVEEEKANLQVEQKAAKKAIIADYAAKKQKSKEGSKDGGKASKGGPKKSIGKGKKGAAAAK